MRDIYVIYHKPSDFPGFDYVMRVHRMKGGDVTPTRKSWAGDTLEEMRGKVPAGMARFDRDLKDDPVIVEWWA